MAFSRDRFAKMTDAERFKYYDRQAVRGRIHLPEGVGEEVIFTLLLHRIDEPIPGTVIRARDVSLVAVAKCPRCCTRRFCRVYLNRTVRSRKPVNEITCARCHWPITAGVQWLSPAEARRQIGGYCIQPFVVCG